MERKRKWVENQIKTVMVLAGIMPLTLYQVDCPIKHLKLQKKQSTGMNLCKNQRSSETIKYYSEIANVIEANEVYLDERSVICDSALEESKGKEVELVTDYLISQTMLTLLQGCDLDHLCGFLQSCVKDFLHIAMDSFGSHIAETTLKALAVTSTRLQGLWACRRYLNSHMSGYRR